MLKIVCHRSMVGRKPAFQHGAGTRFRFQEGPEIIIPILGLDVCPLCSALTLCLPHIQEDLPLCIYLVLWSKVCCSPYRHLDYKPRGVCPKLGESK